MGVYIKMEMPQCCDDCRLNNGISCYAVPEYTEDGVVGRTDDRPEWCPLVPVPPHGRLIDADALIAWFEEWYDPNADLEICHVIDILDDNGVTPTILEAEEGE